MPRPPGRQNNSDPIRVALTLLGLVLRGGPAARLLVGVPVLLAVLTLGWYGFQPRERKEEVNQLVANYTQKHKQIRLTELVWDIWTLYFNRSFVSTGVRTGQQDFVFGGEPERAGFPHAIRPLYNTAYAVGYCDALDNPVWAAYRVFDLKERPHLGRRPESFFVDTRTAARVEPGDYTGSGYDRGHMVPNYAIGTRFGPQAQEETFLMSNVCPQRHSLNAGMWKELELRVADNLTGRFGQVWVLDGPIFGPEDRAPRIHNKVPVPEAFYMIVAQQHEGGVRAQAFVLDQEAPASGDPGRYLTSIAEVERRTGLNFFPKLERQAQEKLENQRPTAMW